jgi:TonB family protein
MEFLLAVSFRSLALATAVWSLLALARVKSPAVRHAAWAVVTGGMLAIALAASILPTMPVRVLRPISPAPAVLVAPVVPASLPAKLPAAPVHQSRSFPWILVYAAGVLVYSGRLVYGYALTRRLLSDATRVMYLDDVIYESSQISVPITIGDKIILPGEWHTWHPEKLEAVLVHERTHVRRADWAIAAMAAVNRCVFWFHPLAWWLEARLRTLAEEACDDASLAQVSRESYAQALIDMAAAVRGTKQRVAWEAMAMAKGAEVRMRIERILDDTRPVCRPVTRTAWTAMAIAAIPAIIFFALARPAHVRAQQQQQQQTQPVIAVPSQPQLQGDAELKRAQAEANQMEQEITRFKRENIGKLPDQFQTNVSQLNTYQMALSNANDAMGRLQQQKLLLETQLTNFNNQLAYYQSQTRDTADNLKTGQLEQRLRDAQSQLEALQETYTEAAPAVKSQKAKIAALERELIDGGRENPANQKMVLDLEGSVGLLKTQIQGINMSMEDQLKKVANLQQVIAQYQARIELLPQLEEQYAQMMRTYQEAHERLDRLKSTLAGPSLISRREAEYTPEARQASLQGKVELSVTVGTDGVPRDIQVIHGLGSGLDKKAIDAVKEWRFRPASLHGERVPAVIVVEVPFRL